MTFCRHIREYIRSYCTITATEITDNVIDIDEYGDLEMGDKLDGYIDSTKYYDEQWDKSFETQDEFLKHVVSNFNP